MVSFPAASLGSIWGRETNFRGLQAMAGCLSASGWTSAWNDPLLTTQLHCRVTCLWVLPGVPELHPYEVILFFIPTIQQGKLPPVTWETCRAELGKAGTLLSHATEANKKSHCVGRGLGVGKGKSSKVGQGRTLAEPTACGLNGCPWVCAGALWELCCDGRWEPWAAFLRSSTCGSEVDMPQWQFAFARRRQGYFLFGVCALKCWHPAIICYDPTS